MALFSMTLTSIFSGWFFSSSQRHKNIVFPIWTKTSRHYYWKACRWHDKGGKGFLHSGNINFNTSMDFFLLLSFEYCSYIAATIAAPSNEKSDKHSKSNMCVCVCACVCAGMRLSRMTMTRFCWRLSRLALVSCRRPAWSMYITYLYNHFRRDVIQCNQMSFNFSWESFCHGM